MIFAKLWLRERKLTFSMGMSHPKLLDLIRSVGAGDRTLLTPRELDIFLYVSDCRSRSA
jgi:hypothetical protein